MEIEGVEQQIFLQPEMAIVGAVYSVNGYTGHVVLTTSDLENTSGYQTSTDVANLISAHNTSEEAHPYIQALISAKQDPIVAGNGISITGGNTVAIDTTVVATQQNLATEVTNRENADIALQGQIDAISASSDVVDIVGTYADLQNYDTSKLKDNDIIKVLQDSTQGNATTYYRWSTSTQTFTLIGQEGPYYTKAAADAQFVPQTRTINSKPLSANITLTASDVSALGQSDIVQTTGTSTSQVMSQNAVTTELATKLDSADVPAGFFDGPATTSPTPATSVELNNVIKLSELELLGDTMQNTTTGKNLLPPVDNFEVELADVNIKYADGVYTINGTSSGSGAHSTSWMIPIVSYTIKSGDYWHYKNDFTSSQLNIQVRFTDNTTFAQTISSMDRIIDLTNYVGKTIQDMRVYFQSGYSFNGTISPMIVNNVSTSTAYEPYTGAVPSPNPDYPQTVEVVTGEQTISISDGTNSTDYTVDLGATELCKIGDYQDYIYKSGDDWYVHKEVGKVVFNGSENWSYNTNSQVFVLNDGADYLRTGFVPFCDHFIGQNSSSFNSVQEKHISFVSMANSRIVIRYSDYTDAPSFNNWLSQNNTTAYYVLATATDTKITDSTLTGQLDALLSAQMYPEYTAISSTGNLPAILGITAYNGNLNGIIEVLASTASTLGN